MSDHAHFVPPAPVTAAELAPSTSLIRSMMAATATKLSLLGGQRDSEDDGTAEHRAALTRELDGFNAEMRKREAGRVL